MARTSTRPSPVEPLDLILGHNAQELHLVLWQGILQQLMIDISGLTKMA